MIKERDRAWAVEAWPRCLRTLDPVKMFGPDVDRDVHPGEIYFSLDEIGMGWIRRFTKNALVRSYGVGIFQEARTAALRSYQDLAEELIPWLFARCPETSAFIAMIYSSNAASLAIANRSPRLRIVGRIDDGGGPGIDLHIFQAVRP